MFSLLDTNKRISNWTTPKRGNIFKCLQFAQCRVSEYNQNITMFYSVFDGEI